MSYEVISKLLASADVQINGSRPWDIKVHDDRLYARILRDRDLGAGEAYMEGWWDCEQLDALAEKFVATDKLLIRHLPDHTKSRGQYLDLLEVTVKEYPLETRHAFFYARELSFYGRLDDSLRELKKYLDMPNANWTDERAYAMRIIGDIYKEFNNFFVRIISLN